MTDFSERAHGFLPLSKGNLKMLFIQMIPPYIDIYNDGSLYCLHTIIHMPVTSKSGVWENRGSLAGLEIGAEEQMVR